MEKARCGGSARARPSEHRHGRKRRGGGGASEYIKNTKEQCTYVDPACWTAFFDSGASCWLEVGLQGRTAVKRGIDWLEEGLDERDTSNKNSTVMMAGTVEGMKRGHRSLLGRDWIGT